MSASRHDVIVTISSKGEILLKVEGINGAKCINETELLEKNLGEVVHIEKTSEFYNSDTSGKNVSVNFQE